MLEQLGQRGRSEDDGAAPTARARPRRGTLPPTLWQFPFTPKITSQLVSWENPSGVITNSDLELAGVIGHNIILSQLTDLCETTTATGTDNVAAHSRSSKKAISSTGPGSYLLRIQAMHQRQFRYQSRTFFVPGVANKMADDCLRLWHLSDSALVAYFNATYPQRDPWQLCHLNPTSGSALLGALLCNRQPLPEVLPASPTATDAAMWHREVPPSVHGLRQSLFDSLAKRPKSWATRTHGFTIGSIRTQ